MKQYNLNKTALVVEVREGASNFRISKGYLWYDTTVFDNVIGFVFTRSYYGNWQILSIAKDMTEELLEKADLMPNAMWLYADYMAISDFGLKMRFYTRLESFRSWMQSENIMDNDLILIKE